MRAGQLKHRITLSQPTMGKDSTGHPKQTGVTTIGTVWAKVETLPSPETTGGDQKQHKAKIEITLRYNPNVNATSSLTWDGKTWNVLDVIHGADKRETILTAVED